ncbi:MAG: glycosyltransferase family 2 protein [Flavobacteriales bacterium]|nr:glycosyltransferase family 2 protein [Flavobacteriales bacterium]MDW8409988.1 glycosyltransferase family 2 protein [Flavobacteriales bacterium]
MQSHTRPRLSVVLPVHNEECSLRPLAEQLEAILGSLVGEDWEILWVDDGSTDSSLRAIKSLCEKDGRHKFLSFSRNFGHQQALLAGLRNCKGECVVVMDADFQDPPHVINQFWALSQQGYDVVYGRRIIRHEGWWKRFTAALFYRLLNRLAEVPIPLDAGDFRLMRRRVVEALLSMPESDRFLRGQVAWLGFRQAEVAYERPPRSAGRPSYTLARSVGLAVSALTGFSAVPLRVASWLGLLGSLATLPVAAWALYARFVDHDYVPGWASLMLTVLFFGSIQLVCLGIIGEYLHRIYNDVRRRPHYVIAESNIPDVK